METNKSAQIFEEEPFDHTKFKHVTSESLQQIIYLHLFFRLSFSLSALLLIIAWNVQHENYFTIVCSKARLKLCWTSNKESGEINLRVYYSDIYEQRGVEWNSFRRVSRVFFRWKFRTKNTKLSFLLMFNVWARTPSEFPFFMFCYS